MATSPPQQSWVPRRLAGGIPGAWLQMVCSSLLDFPVLQPYTNLRMTQRLTDRWQALEPMGLRMAMRGLQRRGGLTSVFMMG